ncbi:MAG: hypothetical protein B6243_01775 [Anaerolineaceae bacterium 4572_5.2]|nr:MAG: hypothetical protein B6243_01775 [Anaerolineaceae bacterium 4572_5.2]
MAIDKKDMKLQFASINELYLDPLNPRVGRHKLGPGVSQEEILELVADWTLDELAYSYLENGGFWLHEALLVVKEELYGKTRLVVIEGNRRLAALKYLYDAHQGNPATRKWKEISESAELPSKLFTEIPYILVKSRKKIQAFLGFRHVTGIKQWDADEKAYFIAKLIDEQGMTYTQVMRIIGSKTPTVRRHYIAYRVLLQIEENVEDYDQKRVDESFAILYMSLDTVGAKKFLNIDVDADPQIVKKPVPQSHLNNLADFARWLYGNSKSMPIINDTRQVPQFGKILENEEATQYLQNSQRPSLELAFQLAGGDEEEIIRAVQQAADNVEQALARVQHYKTSISLQKQVTRLGIDYLALLNHFPHIRKEFNEEFC